MRELTFGEMSFVSGGSGPSGPGNAPAPPPPPPPTSCPAGQTQTGSTVGPNGDVTITCENSWDEAFEDALLLLELAALTLALASQL